MNRCRFQNAHIGSMYSHITIAKNFHNEYVVLFNAEIFPDDSIKLYFCDYMDKDTYKENILMTFADMQELDIIKKQLVQRLWGV